MNRTVLGVVREPGKLLSRTNLVPLRLEAEGLPGSAASLDNFNKLQSNTIQNENGVLAVNSLAGADPIHAETITGIATLSLKHDSSLGVNSDGGLGVDLKATVPLAYDPATGLSLALDTGQLQVVNGVLTLTSQLSTIGQIASFDVEFPAPFTSTISQTESKTTIDLAHDDTLEVTPAGQSGLSDAFKESVTQEISTGALTYDAPLERTADSDHTKQDHVVIQLGKGLEVDSDGNLKTNASDAIECLGGLSDGGLADIGLDEAISVSLPTQPPFPPLSAATHTFPHSQTCAPPAHTMSKRSSSCSNNDDRSEDEESTASAKAFIDDSEGEYKPQRKKTRTSRLSSKDVDRIAAKVTHLTNNTAMIPPSPLPGYQSPVPADMTPTLSISPTLNNDCALSAPMKEDGVVDGDGCSDRKG
ncbi:hypothetical protein HDU87_008733 [Geranomyces variabilis]|uniref:Uncharacterized protein n=1 Tax=Geranomyces variabilis TaxID=109894 RepID=A0AAD5XP27_9FUNG|nr:hypothetical protein HDU87_008733 [Geranomyces variabilis]